MDPIVVTVIVVAVVVLVVVALLAARAHRRRTAANREHLQERFGPEYDRAVADADDTKQAESRLVAAERRRDELDIHPLTAESRAQRRQEWDTVQARFVDEPVEAVDNADRLVSDVMAERGYPTGDVADKLSLLAADHAETVEHYRTAESHRQRFHSGEGSTEDLRRAFVEYRSLFDVLLQDGDDGRRPVDETDRPDTVRTADTVRTPDIGDSARTEGSASTLGGGSTVSSLGADTATTTDEPQGGGGRHRDGGATQPAPEQDGRTARLDDPR